MEPGERPCLATCKWPSNGVPRLAPAVGPPHLASQPSACPSAASPRQTARSQTTPPTPRTRRRWRRRARRYWRLGLTWASCWTPTLTAAGWWMLRATVGAVGGCMSPCMAHMPVPACAVCPVVTPPAPPTRSRDRCCPGINRNRYIALMSAITLRENPGQTIVTDSCTSNGLASFIQQLGGKHFRFKKVMHGVPPGVGMGVVHLACRCRAGLQEHHQQGGRAE